MLIFVPCGPVSSFPKEREPSSYLGSAAGEAIGVSDRNVLVEIPCILQQY